MVGKNLKPFTKPGENHAEIRYMDKRNVQKTPNGRPFCGKAGG